MLAGQIDLGFMGIGPALMGMDSGMPWRFAGGLSQNEVALVAGEGVDSLADFGERDRIAVLSPAVPSISSCAWRPAGAGGHVPPLTAALSPSLIRTP